MTKPREKWSPEDGVHEWRAITTGQANFHLANARAASAGFVLDQVRARRGTDGISNRDLAAAERVLSALVAANHATAEENSPGDRHIADVGVIMPGRMARWKRERLAQESRESCDTVLAMVAEMGSAHLWARSAFWATEAGLEAAATAVNWLRDADGRRLVSNDDAVDVAGTEEILWRQGIDDGFMHVARRSAASAGGSSTGGVQSPGETGT